MHFCIWNYSIVSCSLLIYPCSSLCSRLFDLSKSFNYLFYKKCFKAGGHFFLFMDSVFRFYSCQKKGWGGWIAHPMDCPPTTGFDTNLMICNYISVLPRYQNECTAFWQGLAIKNPSEKTLPKKPKKTPKNPLKMYFFVLFFNFYRKQYKLFSLKQIFYEHIRHKTFIYQKIVRYALK